MGTFRVGLLSVDPEGRELFATVVSSWGSGAGGGTAAGAPLLLDAYGFTCELCDCPPAGEREGRLDAVLILARPGEALSDAVEEGIRRAIGEGIEKFIVVVNPRGNEDCPEDQRAEYEEYIKNAFLYEFELPDRYRIAHVTLGNGGRGFGGLVDLLGEYLSEREPFAMHVDKVIIRKVAIGTISSGKIQTGDAVALLCGDRTVRGKVNLISLSEKGTVSQAGKGDRVQLHLADADGEFIKNRVLVGAEDCRPVTKCNAELTLLPRDTYGFPYEVRMGGRLDLDICDARVMGTVLPGEGVKGIDDPCLRIEPDGSDTVTVALEKPMYVAKDMTFSLWGCDRRTDYEDIVGFGKIVEILE